MRAKFICESVLDVGTMKTAKLSPVRSGSDENDDFNKYTFCGALEISIDKSGAMNYFKPQKEYYLDFSEAKKEE